MNTILYLFRHSLYENTQGIIPGRLPGFHLSSDGVALAKKRAEELRTLPIAAVYSSPVARAYETAVIFAASHSLPVVVDDRLSEVRSAQEGVTLTYFNEVLHGNVYTPELVSRGSESWEDMTARMVECLLEISVLHEGKQVVIVSHGDPIMAVKTWASREPMTYEQSRNGYIQKAEGYTITLDRAEPIAIAPFSKS